MKKDIPAEYIIEYRKAWTEMVRLFKGISNLDQVWLTTKETKYSKKLEKEQP